jgi:hypothetical protein
VIFDTGVNETGSEFATGVNDTGVNDTGGILPPVSMTPAAKKLEVENLVTLSL